jgi:soluble lytic murein transglycosylase-like protein
MSEMITYTLQRLLLSLLFLLFVVLVLGPLLLGGRSALLRAYQEFLYAMNAPQTTYTISDSYAALAQSDAVAAGIPPDLFERQINQESGFNPYAQSPAGAQGIAQFMPATAAGLGIDPWDPVQSLWGAAQLMARYRDNYAGDYAKALAAYNGGSGRLAWAMQQCGDNWLSCEPLETQRYVHLILNS